MPGSEISVHVVPPSVDLNTPLLAVNTPAAVLLPE